MNYPNISSLFISPESSIHDAIECIDRSGHVSIALIVDEHQQLIGTITDGDIRRGILAGLGMSDPISKLLPIKAQLPHPAPVVASVETDPAHFLRIMQENAIKQLPLLDADGSIVDIVILSELFAAHKTAPAGSRHGWRAGHTPPATHRPCSKADAARGGTPDHGDHGRKIAQSRELSAWTYQQTTAPQILSTTLEMGRHSESR